MTVTAASTDRHLHDHLFRQLIDGQLVDGGTTQAVIDPATGKSIATAPIASPVNVEAAVRSAARAFPNWRDTPFAERCELVSQMADAIEARRADLAKIIVLETGKPLEAAEGDVDLAVTWARDVAGMSLEPKVLRDDAEAYIEERRKPIGVVAAILSWNFPFFQMVYKVAPALVAGNTVVVKPSPTTPLNAMVFGEILQGIVPDGVVNILGDDGEVGPILTSHPDVGKVSFTGSTAAGRKVMANGASTLKRLVLELGGNDSAIVMEDADIPKVAQGIFSWAFMNSGQVCINIKRVFVPASTYDRFCDEFARLARDAKVGHGLDAGTDLGPVQNARQFEAMQSCLEIAHRDGTVIAGGSVLDGPGYFVQPTVVRDISPDSSLVKEETFGPIRSIIRYDDIEDAIATANGTDYGLGNSVWGENIDQAVAVADRLESGTVWINTHFALQPDVPFGGRKQSGLGVEFGAEGLEEFTDVHVINVARA